MTITDSTRHPAKGPADERRRRLHAMSKGDEHMALSWLCDHMPEAFEKAAAYLDRVHAMDERIAANTPARRTR